VRFLRVKTPNQHPIPPLHLKNETHDNPIIMPSFMRPQLLPFRETVRTEVYFFAAWGCTFYSNCVGYID
jgi:hypothetical protein